MEGAAVKEAGPDSGNSDEESDGEAQFEGWTMEDHEREMEDLRAEFDKLKQRQYNDTIERLEEQIRNVNAGTDSEFKLKLALVEQKSKESVVVIEERKKMMMQVLEENGTYEMVSAEMSYEEGKKRLREVVKERLELRKRRALKNKEVMDNIPEGFEENWNEPPPPPTTTSRGRSRHEEEAHTAQESRISHEQEPAPVPQQHLPPIYPLDRRGQPKRRTNPLTSSDPIIYMLTEEEIYDDLRHFWSAIDGNNGR